MRNRPSLFNVFGRVAARNARPRAMTRALSRTGGAKRNLSRDPAREAPRQRHKVIQKVIQIDAWRGPVLDPGSHAAVAACARERAAFRIRGTAANRLDTVSRVLAQDPETAGVDPFGGARAI